MRAVYRARRSRIGSGGAPGPWQIDVYQATRRPAANNVLRVSIRWGSWRDHPTDARVTRIAWRISASGGRAPYGYNIGDATGYGWLQTAKVAPGVVQRINKTVRAWDSSNPRRTGLLQTSSPPIPSRA